MESLHDKSSFEKPDFSIELSETDLVKWKKKIESFHIDISFIRFEPIVNKEGRSN